MQYINDIISSVISNVLNTRRLALLDSLLQVTYMTFLIYLGLGQLDNACPNSPHFYFFTFCFPLLFRNQATTTKNMNNDVFFLDVF